MLELNPSRAARDTSLFVQNASLFDHLKFPVLPEQGIAC